MKLRWQKKVFSHYYGRLKLADFDKPGQLFQDDFCLWLVVCVDVLKVPEIHSSAPGAYPSPAGDTDHRLRVRISCMMSNWTSNPNYRRFLHSLAHLAIANPPPSETLRPSAPQDNQLDPRDYHDDHHDQNNDHDDDHDDGHEDDYDDYQDDDHDNNHGDNFCCHYVINIKMTMTRPQRQKWGLALFMEMADLNIYYTNSAINIAELEETNG